MKRCVALLLALCLLSCCGCAMQAISEDEGQALRLYYPATLEDVPGGDAITYVNVDWKTLPQDDKQALVQAIMELLLGGCEEEDFVSPIPAGTKLLSCTLNGSVVLVDFSSAYGQLSGIQLTMADYCVTLSLTQLSEVHSVRITVNGQELSYRDTNRFLAGDVLLSSTEDVVRTLAVNLYFPDENGQLVKEERLLSYYEGQSRMEAVMDALLAGPETESLQLLLPEGFAVLSVRLEDGICYLNLPADDIGLLPEEGAAQRTMLQGIVNSLCSIEDISGVQIMLDGASAETFGAVNISQPLEAK